MNHPVIHTALCSFGMSGKLFHAPFIVAHPGFQLYGVWERTKNEAAQKYPAVKTFRSLEEILADERVELVVVNTPSVTHFDYAQQCLEAGKHVIVEKPFTATAAEAEALIQLAATKNRKLSVYQNRRYDSDFRTVKKILTEGWLGELVEMNIHYDRYVPQLSAKPHKEAPTPAVGGLYDLGSHLIDQALQLFGMPQALFADITHFREGSQVDDYFDLKLYYSRHRVILKSSYFVREPMPGYQVHGRLGSFIKPKTDVQEIKLQAGEMPGGEHWGVEPESQNGLLHTEKNGMIVRETIPSEKGNYGDYYEGIYRALTYNEPVPVPATEAKNVIRVIEAAFRSHKTKCVVEL